MTCGEPTPPSGNSEIDRGDGRIRDPPRSPLRRRRERRLDGGTAHDGVGCLVGDPVCVCRVELTQACEGLRKRRRPAVRCGVRVAPDKMDETAGHEAEHRRRKAGEPPAPLSEHRVAKLASVHGARARSYEMRQQLLGLGQDALTLLTAIVHRSPMQSHARVQALHELLCEHGDDAMRTAIRHAVASDDLTVAAVSEALSGGLS